MTIDEPRDDWQFVRLYAWRLRFDQELAKLNNAAVPTGVEQLLWKAQAEAIKGVRDEMKEQLDVYALRERQGEAFGDGDEAR